MMKNLGVCYIIGILTLSVAYATEDKGNEESNKDLLANITLVNGDFTATDPDNGSIGSEESSKTGSLDSVETDELKQEVKIQSEINKKQARISANRGTRASIFCVCQKCGGWPGCSAMPCPNCGATVPECETSHGPSGQPGSSNCDGCTGQP